jgi:hypothetical protein
MNALMTKNEANVSAADQVAVSKEDVAAIVDELEVTEELAERTLRQAALEMRDSDSVLFVALRKLVTST